MRFGIVISAYNRGAGLERVAVEYARGLRDRGHEITVFAQVVQREPADEGIRFVRVGGLKGHIAARAATFPIAATRAVDKVPLDNILSFGSVVQRPAVVRLPGCHRSWWEFASETWPATTKEGFRRRLNPHHRFILWWDGRVFGTGLPKAVLTAGSWTAEDVKRFYPAVAPVVSVLADGVNLDEFGRDEAGGALLRKEWGGSPLLLTVATELKRKGLGSMFDAFRLVREREPDAILVVGGRVPMADVRALAVQHRVEDGILPIGFIEDLSAAYSAADALVFPTLFDPWGLPIVEGLACGLPAAASARAGASEVLTDGVNGVSIPDPTDAQAVADAILRAAAMTVDRAALRASVEHLRWENIVTDLERVMVDTADA